MKTQLSFVSFVFLFSNIAAANSTPQLAVGQSISSPHAYTSVNFANGFTYANSGVAASFSKPNLTLETDFGDNNDDGDDDLGFGGEFSLGSGTAGLAVGYYDRDCTGCDGRVGAIGGIAFGKMSIGLGFREDDLYSLGILWNASSAHHFGLTLDTFQSDATDADITSFGAGYSYRSQNFILAIDASKRSTQSNADDDDIVQITPGFEIHNNEFALSVSYDNYMNDDSDIYDNDVWFGVGYRTSNLQFSIYHDYVNDWTASLAIQF